MAKGHIWLSQTKAETHTKEEAVVIRTFRSPCVKLVDRFYQETKNILAYQQYEAARNDPEYFMQLILLAYRYYEGEGDGRVLH